MSIQSNAPNDPKYWQNYRATPNNPQWNSRPDSQQTTLNLDTRLPGICSANLRILAPNKLGTRVEAKSRWDVVSMIDGVFEHLNNGSL
jgi:hypothetical protein